MSEQAQETVIDVLDRESLEAECHELRQFCMGMREATELSYEDWVRPLKLTGGRVCLREGRPDGLAPIWYCWQSDGLRAQAGSIRADNPSRAVTWLKGGISAPTSTLTPVLRADTPFAEGEHD